MEDWSEVFITSSIQGVIPVVHLQIKQPRQPRLVQNSKYDKDDWSTGIESSSVQSSSSSSLSTMPEQDENNTVEANIGLNVGHSDISGRYVDQLLEKSQPNGGADKGQWRVHSFAPGPVTELIKREVELLL